MTQPPDIFVDDADHERLVALSLGYSCECSYWWHFALDELESSYFVLRDLSGLC